MTETLTGYPGLTVERNVFLELDDVTRLAADIYRPSLKHDFPVLLTRLPYDKTEAGANLGYAHPAWYAAQGYMVVAQDVRGRWASEGEFYPFLHEETDGLKSVRWAAGLPGSNGLVGMYGFSYGGATQLLAAVSGAPELKAVCPGFTWSQAFQGGIYTNGAFNLAFAAGWATLLAQQSAARAGREADTAMLQAAYREALKHFWTLPLKDFPPLKDGQAPYFQDWLTHPVYDDYWARWSIDAAYDKINVPALHIGGWYDAFISGTIKNFTGLRAQAGGQEVRRAQKLLVGPWWHMPWNPLDPAAFLDREAVPNLVDDWQIRWFDHFLKNKHSGVLDHPVTVYQPGRGWLDLEDWPPKNSRPQEVFLHSGGRANSAWGDGSLSPEPPQAGPPDIFTYSPSVPALSAGGHSCCRPFMSPMGPADQAPRESSNTVLVYTSAPLEKELSLMGPAGLVLYAASTAVDTDFTARLCRVDAGGKSINLQEGIVRARYRDSLTDPRPITPGRVYEYQIDLGPVCALLKPGERLRLTVSSSDFPQWDRNLNTGGPIGKEGVLAAKTCTQTVLHDQDHPSRLILPVVRY